MKRSLILLATIFAASLASAEETPLEQLRWVSASNLNVRVTPSLEGQVITRLPRATAVTLVAVSANPEFCEVRVRRTSADVLHGFVACEYLMDLAPPEPDMAARKPYVEGGLPCGANGDCSDLCVYFQDETTFASVGDRPRLWFADKAHDLVPTGTRVIRSPQGNAELPGYVRSDSYRGEKLRAAVVYSVTDTSCYEKDERGVWASVDKCCWTSYDVELTLTGTLVDKKKVLRTQWVSGC